MSSPSYQVWLRDINTDALHLDLTGWLLQLEWSRIVSEVGGFSLVLPEKFPKEYLNLDAHLDWRVEIWRRPDDSAPLNLEQIGLIRRVSMQTDEAGKTVYTVSGPDLMHLLTRRVSVPKDQNKVGVPERVNYADDMMRDLVRHNYITNSYALWNWESTNNTTVATRNLPTTAGWTFQVEVDSSSVVYCDPAANGDWMKCAGKRVLDSLKDLYQWSREPDTNRPYLYFHIDFDDYKTWTFRVHPNRVGMDHTMDSRQPVLIGLDYGNLSIPVLDYDRSDEWTNAICDDGSLPTPFTFFALDNTRKGHSCINYSEAYETHGDAPKLKTGKLLNKGRRKKIFTGKVIYGPGSIYGLHWHFGDEVTIGFLGQQYDADMIGIRATLDSNGQEEMSVTADIPPV